MADKQAIMMALKEAMAGGGGAPATSQRPQMRPKMIGGMPGGEDLMRLLMSAGAKSPKKPAGMMRGGEVQQYKSGGAVRKKNGCVMKGRGGKYKGMK